GAAVAQVVDAAATKAGHRVSPISRRVSLRETRPHRAGGQPCRPVECEGQKVGNESRMRESCTSGSTSGSRKRNCGRERGTGFSLKTPGKSLSPTVTAPAPDSTDVEATFAQVSLELLPLPEGVVERLSQFAF